MRLLHYSDAEYASLPPELVRQENGLDEQRTLLETLRSELSAAEDHARDVRAEYATFRENEAELERLGRESDIAAQAKRDEAFTEAVANACFDHDGAMNAIDKHQQRVSYFRNAVTHARAFAIPRMLVKRLEADEAVATARCSVASQTALIAACERWIAAEPLLNSEAVVEFSPGSGRTGQLIEAAKYAFEEVRRASAAHIAERSRQHELGIGIFGGRQQ